MQRIEEIFSKNIRLETNDPFSLALKIMDMAREYGEPVEKKNVYETDGPRKKVEFTFEMKRDVDKLTTAKIYFDLTGETNSEGFLEIMIKGKIETNIHDTGPVSRTFNDYYDAEILPLVKKEYEKLKLIGNAMESKIMATQKPI